MKREGRKAFPFCLWIPRLSLAPGAVAKWLCSGLQSRVRRFDSGPRLHFAPAQQVDSGMGEPAVGQAIIAMPCTSTSMSGRARPSQVIKALAGNLSLNSSLRMSVKAWP